MNKWINYIEKHSEKKAEKDLVELKKKIKDLVKLKRKIKELEKEILSLKKQKDRSMEV